MLMCCVSTVVEEQVLAPAGPNAATAGVLRPASDTLVANAQQPSTSGPEPHTSRAQRQPLPAIPIQKQAVEGSSRTPNHMSNPIVFNQTGPVFRAAGLRRPVNSKPLHQIQPLS